MSQDIKSSSPLIHRAPLPDLQPVTAGQQAASLKKQTFERSGQQRSNFLRSLLQNLAAGREHEDDKSFKAFTKLSRTVEQTFGKAEKISRNAGETELKQGGIWRINQDLGKLFKELGMPPHLARHFSGNISRKMDNETLAQVSLPLAGSRSQNPAQQLQSGYLASGTAKMTAADSSLSFQLAAIQSGAIDISINLQTGKFTLSQTHADTVSNNLSDTAATAGTPPAVVQADGAPDDIDAVIQNVRIQMQISRMVKQSAILQLNPPPVSTEAQTADEPFSSAVGEVQQLVERLGELTENSRDRFESLLEISNLRIETDAENVNHLRFTADAKAPIGLTAVDAKGRGTTIYPRPDGSLGKIVEAGLKVTA